MDGRGRVLFIGLGYEAEMILRYLLKQKKILAENVAFTRKDENLAKPQSERLKIPYFTDNALAINSFSPDVLFIGVKPQNLASVLHDIVMANETWSELISIVGSTPFELVAKTFYGKKISCVLPDDKIVLDDPQSYTNYCSTDEDDGLVKDIFEPTAKKLIRVKPEKMVLFNSTLCQGSAILFFLVSTYHGSWESFHKYSVEFFKRGVEFLYTQTAFGNNDGPLDLVAGYRKYAQVSALGQDLFLEVMKSVFLAMAQRELIYSYSRENLLREISLWATKGGYEEAGIETVEKFLDTGRSDYEKLPSLMMGEMIERGKGLEEQIIRGYGLLTGTWFG